MFKFVAGTCAVILLIPTILYVLSPIEPVTWRPDVNSSLSGPLAKNNKLDQVTLLNKGQLPEPEDITFDDQGYLYTALNDGRIVRFLPPAPHNIEEYANTQGRPLGLRFNQTGNLIVADAVHGLLSINKTGDIEVLVNSFEGRRLKLVDHVDVAKNGDVYFSDASERYGLHNYLLDFLEASATGSVYKYSASLNTTERLMSNIFFSNGVALNSDESFLVVAETGKARILKYHLLGSKKGQTEIFVDALPAMPDNIYFDNNGTFWVGLIALRDWRVEGLSSFPFIRKLIGGIPAEALKPKNHYGFVIGINELGSITHNYQTQSTFTNITAAVPYKGDLYLGALDTNAVAVLRSFD